jgi:hypothetical protein
MVAPSPDPERCSARSWPQRPNPRAALGALYMRVLSRQPTNQEVEVCSKYLAAVGNPAEAFEDIYWSLINSTEFLTRR